MRAFEKLLEKYHRTGTRRHWLLAPAFQSLDLKKKKLVIVLSLSEFGHHLVNPQETGANEVKREMVASTHH